MIYIMWDRCHHFANQNISGMHTIYSIHPWYAIYYILYAKLTGMHTPGPDGEYAGGSGDHEYLFFGQWSWSNGAKKVSKSVPKMFLKSVQKRFKKSVRKSFKKVAEKSMLEAPGTTSISSLDSAASKKSLKKRPKKILKVPKKSHLKWLNQTIEI